LQDRNTYIVASHTGRYTAKTDLTECSCRFFENFGLPCRHLLFLSKREEILLPVEEYKKRWRLNDDEVKINQKFPNNL
jgi:hypothetical protein